MTPSPTNISAHARIENCILQIRGKRVIVDNDLAQLYGVSTKALNQAVKRNLRRFPGDFMFQLNGSEKQEVVTNCDHLVRLKFSKSMPFAFTEHGAIQAANILNSAVAIDMGVYVVRAFISMREAIVSNKELELRLDKLEDQGATLVSRQDNLEHESRLQIQKILDALRALVTPPVSPTKRPIGFITPEDSKTKNEH
jgi:hypothetical protein